MLYYEWIKVCCSSKSISSDGFSPCPTPIVISSFVMPSDLMMKSIGCSPYIPISSCSPCSPCIPPIRPTIIVPKVKSIPPSYSISSQCSCIPYILTILIYILAPTCIHPRHSSSSNSSCISIISIIIQMIIR